MVAAVALGCVATITGAAEDDPRRVVSMNLCTDQLAMLLAAKGQLVSVSDLAVDPRASAMVEQARGYTINHARAEEVHALRPDLVLAGQYSSRASVGMLRRLGIRVETFAPARSMDDIGAALERMGALLGREEAGKRAAARFEERLSALRAEVERRPEAALYYANGYTLGDKTLAGQILLTAGFSNTAAKAGITGGRVMPLEQLVMYAPEALISGTSYSGETRSEAILDHPAVELLRRSRPSAEVRDRDWICGTPQVLRAVEGLGDLRRKALEGEG